MRFGRIAYLGWRQLLLNRLRWTMLTCTTVTALLVFLVMHALSSASTGELDDAVEATLGYEGTYSIEIPNDLAEPILETADTLTQLVREHDPIATVTFIDLPDVLERCVGRPDAESARNRPHMSTEIPRLVVILDAADTSTLGGGERIEPADGDWCLDGLRMDPIDRAEIASFVSRALNEQTAPVLIGREQLDRTTADRPQPPSITNLSVLPHDEAPNLLRAALGESFGPAALRAGQAPGWTNLIDVRRIDSGDELRAAGKGVRLVYGLIGVAVLGVGAAALLIAQLMTNQARAWFYALTVAWGARRRDIIALAASEVCVVVAISLAATLAVAAAADGPISRWTVKQFGQAMHIFDPSLLVGLVVAAGAVILTATVPTAVAVSRTDPLDVLE